MTAFILTSKYLQSRRLFGSCRRSIAESKSKMNSPSDYNEDDVDIESLKWCEDIYTLTEFLEKMKLPQIVCVRDGYYDLADVTTLSTDQVMTLHTVKTCRMLKAISERNEEISIPTNIEGKVEILSNKLPKMYKSVKAVYKDWPPMVISLHNHVWLGVLAKDVLKLESVKKRKLKDFLCCSFVNKQADNVEIPMSYDACFQSYEEPKYIKVNQVETHCKLPCTVKIQAKSPIKPNVDDPSESLDLSTFGRIELLHAYNYRKVITSIRYQEKTSILQVPVDLEITVLAAVGAVEKESRYQTICARIHQKTQLGQLDGMELDYVKMGNQESSVDNIYDYIDFSKLKLKRNSEIESIPEKEKPPVPSRAHRPSIRDSSKKPSTTESESTASTSTAVTPPSSPSKVEDISKEETIIPENLETMKVEEVADCLRHLHMDVYVDKFVEEQIDGVMLVELNEQMMEESLGITNKLHQKKLLMLIKGWRPK